MPAFTFTDTEGRVYPDLALTVAPGDVVELDTNPDPARFTEAATVAATPAAEPAPEPQPGPAPEPAPDEPTTPVAPESETP